MKPAFENGQGAERDKPDKDVPEGPTGAGQEGFWKSRSAKDRIDGCRDKGKERHYYARLRQPLPEGLVVYLSVIVRPVGVLE